MTAKLKKTIDEAGAAVEDAAGQVAGQVAGAAQDAAERAAGVRETLAGAADEARARAGEMMRKARDGVEGASEAIAGGAGAGLSALRDSAVERAEEARESLSDAGERLAATLRRAAEDETAAPIRARVYASAAEGVTSAAGMLREHSVADLAADLRALARRHPGAFMAAAAIAGFAAARFLRASAARHDAERRP